MNKLKQLPNSLLIVLIVAAAVAIATVIMLTAPTPERKAKAAVSRLVEVMDIKKSQQRPSWMAGGEVSASQRVSLTSQVTGNLISLNPLAIPGAVLDAGTSLAQIDPQDFELQIIQKEAAAGADHVPLIILTSRSVESKLMAAISDIEALPTISGDVTRIRVEALG